MKRIVVIALFLGTTALAADQISTWNSIMLSTVAAQNPFAQARFAAITHIAVFEAVNAISGDYKPYLGTITAPGGASAEAAAVAAAYAVLKNYFPDSAASLDASRTTSLATIPDGPGKSAGIRGRRSRSRCGHRSPSQRRRDEPTSLHAAHWSGLLATHTASVCNGRLVALGEAHAFRSCGRRSVSL